MVFHYLIVLIPRKNIDLCKKRFDIVLFDLGGTLLYFDGDWPFVFSQGASILTGWFNLSGYHLPEGEFQQAFLDRIQRYYIERDTNLIEYTTAHVLRKLLADYGYQGVPDDQIKEALARFYSVSQGFWHIEADTLETISQLHEEGYHLGIVSNAGDNTDVQTLVDMHGLRNYFQLILVSAAVGYRKPHPRIFEIALTYWHAKSSQAIMVGDSLSADILGAQNSHIAGVWITRRVNRQANDDHPNTIQPDATIQTLADLPALLQKWPSQDN
jgi:putative hydrolase of the HAD superfamily